MDDKDYEMAFQLIALAGASKSESMLAIESASKSDFDSAERYLLSAEEKLTEAHRLQTQLVYQEVQGTPVPVNVILVHAQDHLTMAIMAKSNADEFLRIYRILNEIKNRV